MNDALERIAPTLREAPRKPLALALLLRLVVGDIGPDVTAWLRACTLRWLRSDGSVPLPVMLHLGGSPHAVHIAMRNLWLVDAAAYVRACRLRGLDKLR